ncbi:3-dehydroquinate synthase [Candidatus Endobugula sertula]|uniref:3-dehydroquinate synthase n=1 Tax=Candidatus Endobugula sertula TaxID=62101 RepID=A0A1D2QRX1_9GAMM|nr:3-dehydroquinate synthase [Candidatus Endobugula sertula]
MRNNRLTVELGDQHSYPIYIGQELLSDADKLRSYIRGRQVCIVTNETIAPLYLEKVKRHLDAYQVNVVILPDGESFKTLDTVKGIYDCLLENNHNRTTTLIALGGGVVGDMTGYAAATYQRGVAFIQIPTTLLSQVDSSVGGKTGVNHPLGKNMVGAFHQPQCVIIDTDVLKTLPARELSAGMAEVIKYGLIADLPFYQWIEENITPLMSCDEHLMVEAITRSCQNKADVVLLDEKEDNIRAILNLGHTFGHAIETAQSYGVWLHGEAVAAGMVVALELSHLMGNIARAEVERLCNLLTRAHLPTRLPDNMSVEQFLALMLRDKKVLDGRLRLVLLESVGKAVVTDKASIEQVTQAIKNCF